MPLEIEHSLQLNDRTELWDTQMLTPLFKGADSPLLHARAAQLFLLFI